MPKPRLGADLRVRIEQVLALAVFAWLAYRTYCAMRAAWDYTQDDAYITLRYARNLVEGHGLSWNVGETIPVEGYSNFLFVVLGAAALKVGVDPVLLLKVLGCVVVAPTCALLYVLARRWVSPLLATLPALFLTLHIGETFWAVSGMETTVFQLFVVGAITAFVLGMDAPLEAAPDTGRLAKVHTRTWLHRLSAALCLLASMTRPEAPILVILLALTAALDTAGTWLRGDTAAKAQAKRAFMVSLRAFVIVFLAPCALYYAWRIAHFGRLLPNTVYCKATYNEKGEDPWFLVKDFWTGGKIYVAFAVVALLQSPKKLGVKALPLIVLPMAYVAILHHADPVIGQYSRHFLAALALVVVLAAMGIANLVAWFTWPVRWALKKAGAEGAGVFVTMVASLGVVLACGALYLKGERWLEDDSPRKCAKNLSDSYKKDPWLLTPAYDLAYHASCYQSRQDGRIALGEYLDRTYPPSAQVVLGDVGAAGYYAHTGIIDAFCLNSAVLTRPPISYDRERYLDWIFEQKPEAIVVHSLSPAPRLFPAKDEAGFYARIVNDPRFRELYEPTAGAPSFHGPVPREGFTYVVCERKQPPP